MSQKFKHGMRGTRVYNSWQAMKKRCLNKNRKNYKYYGGRGIVVCEKWMEFENFYKDMGECPRGKTLDRINNNLGYFKENCCWSTPRQQNNNRRDNHFLVYKGKTQTIAQWSRELDINYKTIYSRIKRGWNIEKIFNKLL
jgi:hypothetical protein